MEMFTAFAFSMIGRESNYATGGRDGPRRNKQKAPDADIRC
ncbi:hypothetical protein [Paenibacillus sp. UNC496MF]|nr:hypothetical protein [Paenibacillus sp. UNC496MF]